MCAIYTVAAIKCAPPFEFLIYIQSLQETMRPLFFRKDSFLKNQFFCEKHNFLKPVYVAVIYESFLFSFLCLLLSCKHEEAKQAPHLNYRGVDTETGTSQDIETSGASGQERHGPSRNRMSRYINISIPI